MAEGKKGKILGWLGILCLVIFWTVRLVPETADVVFGVSSPAKFAVFGIFLAAVILPAVAGVRGSKLWLLVAAVSLATLVDSYVRFFSRPLR